MKHEKGFMFLNELLTDQTQCTYPVCEASPFDAAAPKGAGSAEGYGAVETTPRIAQPNYPYTLTRAEKKAARIQVLNPETGSVRAYSGLHVERLFRQGRAYVDTEGTVVLGIPPIDPERVYLRHSTLNLPVTLRRLPWRPCWRTLKSSVLPWWPDQRTTSGGGMMAGVTQQRIAASAKKPRLDQLDGDPQE